MKNFSDFGYNKYMPNPTPCIHVFEYVHRETCPHCGRYTHEPDHTLNSKLFKEFYESEEPKKYICPIDGGTIRGWWSI